MVTFNHENFIEKCLESLLNQVVDFDYEVVVGVDHCSDNTAAIVKNIIDGYSGGVNVRAIFHEKNVGAKLNYISAHDAAIGEYIAHIDGDDYALPGKLKSQVDVLDRHPDCNVVWHRMKILRDLVESNDSTNLENCRLKVFKRSDLLSIGSIGFHSSEMYRAKMRLTTYPEQNILDFYVATEHIGDGTAIYINDILGGYRYGVGMSTAVDVIRRMLIDNLKMLKDKYPEERSNISAHAILLCAGDLFRFRRTFFQSFGLVCLTFNFSSLFKISRVLHLRKLLRKI